MIAHFQPSFSSQRLCKRQGHDHDDCNDDNEDNDDNCNDDNEDNDDDHNDDNKDDDDDCNDDNEDNDDRENLAAAKTALCCSSLSALILATWKTR